ncbi:uncharacterized protein L201_005530 [Kwoniella dendrophila CBS 6074]|uniref:MPN domain-containing protein n=1 Tax=Kwoniella dendrophila CBS 6074 TaxID=1295534 RepID=A0AAX4K0E8_9TREE
MASPQQTYTLNNIAYSIPILHAALHPSSTVIGVFLSSLSSSSSSSTDSSEGILEVEDAIPLIHSYTNLSPITEISLSLASEYVKLRQKKIVGIYIAKENDSVEGLGREGERILNALLKESSDSNNSLFGLVLNNDNLAKGQFAYIPYIPNSSSSSAYKQISPETFRLSSAELPSKLLQIIRAKKIHRSLSDFDDNLEDPDADWLENVTAKKDIHKYLS